MAALVVAVLAGCYGDGGGAGAGKEAAPSVRERSVEGAGPAGGGDGGGREASAHSGPVARVELNTPSEVVALRLVPRLVTPGTPVKVEARGEDREGDRVTFFYQWYRNDEPVDGATTDTLDTTGFKKGDIVWAVVTPYDGWVKGVPISSPRLVIANSPPEITSFPPVEADSGVYVYQVEARDPDGDPLTFSVEGAPEGMTIDPETGLLRWPFEGETGTYSLRIIVSDGDAVAFQSFTVGLE